MVIHLAETLDVPKSERNRLLHAAGFASKYVANDLTSEAMKPIRSALSWTLERHNPYPGFALDRHWNIIESNDTALRMLELMGQPNDLSMLDLLLGDTGLRDCVANWDEVSTYLLARLKTENEHLGGDPIFESSIQQLRDIQGDKLSTTDRPSNPMVAIELSIGPLRLSMLSSIAAFGAADDFALADLKIELFYPANDATRMFFEGLTTDGQ